MKEKANNLITRLWSLIKKIMSSAYKIKAENIIIIKIINNHKD